MVCISMICKGYTEGDNNFLKSYDPSKPAVYYLPRR